MIETQNGLRQWPWYILCLLTMLGQCPSSSLYHMGTQQHLIYSHVSRSQGRIPGPSLSPQRGEMGFLIFSTFFNEIRILPAESGEGGRLLVSIYSTVSTSDRGSFIFSLAYPTPPSDISMPRNSPAQGQQKLPSR